VRVAASFALLWAYCQLLLAGASTVWPRPLTEGMQFAREGIRRPIREALAFLGAEEAGFELNGGLFLAAVGIVAPLVVAALVMRTGPRGLGCRLPNRVGWRWLVLGYLMSAPFLAFMASGPGMARYYLPHADRVGPAAFLAYYLINMASEHFLLHGFALAALRGAWRWPDAPAVVQVDREASWWRRMLLHLGLSGGVRSAGQSRITVWFQLPANCGFAVLGSAGLFALVHVGKDWREAALSVPGGIALAILAYRGNSWYIPFLLHLLTAGTTFGLMWLWHA